MKLVEVLIFSAIGLMIPTALSALVSTAAMGGNSDYAVFNLNRTGDTLARRMWRWVGEKGPVKLHEGNQAALEFSCEASTCPIRQVLREVAPRHFVAT